MKAQLLRFRRICTREGDRVQAVKTLFGALRRRGYSRQFLRTVAKEEAAGREGRNTSQRKRILPLVVRYSGTARGLALGIQKNFSRLAQGEALGTQYRVVAAYKKGRNLYDRLVHSQLGPASGKGKKKTLDTLKKGGRSGLRVRGGQSGVYKLTQAIPLNRRNCIYLIRCAWCGKRYVGETRNLILTRMWGHWHGVRKGTLRKGNLVPHFRRHGIQNLQVSGLEHNPEWGVKDRRRREKFWINRLDTWFPRGLNIRMG